MGVQDHADGAGQDGHAAADACILVAGRPDREVVVAIAVEVPGHDRGTELVELVLIGERSEAAVVLREPPRLAGDAEVAHSIEDVEAPDVDVTRVGVGAVRTRRSHGEVVDAIAVEVATRQARAEAAGELAVGPARLDHLGAVDEKATAAGLAVVVDDHRAVRHLAGRTGREVASPVAVEIAAEFGKRGSRVRWRSREHDRYDGRTQ